METNNLQPEEYRRYSRHLLLAEIGLAGQQKLKQAKVLVIGAGGLGCPVLQYLTAAGVGTIGIVDNDVIEESNLQRQVLYGMADVGKLKAQVACEKLNAQNPLVTLISHITYLTVTNALEIIAGYDIVVDGSDNFPTRYLVNDACVMLSKPFVAASIFKFEGQLSVFNYKNGPTYRCLYPEAPEADEVPNCSEIGVLGVLPGIIGSLQANEVIKLIVGKGMLLSGKLLSFNLLTMSFQTFDFELNISNKSIYKLITIDPACETKPFAIFTEELRNKQEQGIDLQLIDVREPVEHVNDPLAGDLIPMNEVPENIHLISRIKPVIIYCQKGSRSDAVVKLLRQKFGFENVFSLAGGLEAY